MNSIKILRFTYNGESCMKAIFVGGCQRSGTTLLGSMIGGNDNIICIPEDEFTTSIYMKRQNKQFCAKDIWENVCRSNFFVRQWEFTEKERKYVEDRLGTVMCYRQLIEILINTYAIRLGKGQCKYFVSHTPSNIIRSDILLEIFPEARFIHIVRDGRAVANSLMKTDFGANTPYYAAYQWSREVSMGFMAQYLSKTDNFMVVKYEDIVNNLQQEMLKICKYLNIDFQEEMLYNLGYNTPKYNTTTHRLIGKKIEKARIDKWKEEISIKDIGIFESHAKDVMRMLNYVPLCEHCNIGMMTKVKMFAKEYVTTYIVAKISRKLRYIKSRI